MIPKYFVIALIILFACKTSFAAGFKSLEEVLDLAYKNNPGIAASRYSLDAEKSLVVSKATLDDPRIGVSTLDRNSRTQYGTITQKIQFPVKYILQAKAQNSHAESFKSKLDMKKLEIRQQVISLYYAIYSTRRDHPINKS